MTSVFSAEGRNTSVISPTFPCPPCPLCVEGVGFRVLAHRAQLGRVGGSRWGWVLYMKYPCNFPVPPAAQMLCVTRFYSKNQTPPGAAQAA